MLLLVVLLFKMVAGYNAEVLSSVPQHKKDERCFIKKRCVLDKLYSGISYSGVGQEFNVNESTNKVYLNRNTHNTRLRIKLMRLAGT